MGFDRTEILPGLLYQGSVPPEGYMLAEKGFDAVFLCAGEHQPRAELFPSMLVYYCPLRDVRDPTAEEIQAAKLAGRQVAMLILRNKRVLVTCAMGWNRSGLVNAFALMRLGMPPKIAIARIKNRRKNALSNPTFVRLLID